MMVIKSMDLWKFTEQLVKQSKIYLFLKFSEKSENIKPKQKKVQTKFERQQTIHKNPLSTLLSLAPKNIDQPSFFGSTKSIKGLNVLQNFAKVIIIKELDNNIIEERKRLDYLEKGINEECSKLEIIEKRKKENFEKSLNNGKEIVRSKARNASSGMPSKNQHPSVFSSSISKVKFETDQKDDQIIKDSFFKKRNPSLRKNLTQNHMLISPNNESFMDKCINDTPKKFKSSHIRSRQNSSSKLPSMNLSPNLTYMHKEKMAKINKSPELTHQIRSKNFLKPMNESITKTENSSTQNFSKRIRSSNRSSCFMQSHLIKANNIKDSRAMDYSNLELDDTMKLDPIKRKNHLFVENSKCKLDDLINTSQIAEEINNRGHNTIEDLKKDQDDHFEGIEKNFNNLYEIDHYQGALDQQDVLEELKDSRKKTDIIMKGQFKKNSDKKAFLGAEYYSNVSKRTNFRKYAHPTINFG